MAMDKNNSIAITIAATCFVALTISICFLKQVITNPKKRKKSCYLNTESKPQFTFKRVLADNSYSQFNHLKPQTQDSFSNEESPNLHPYKGEISKLQKSPNSPNLHPYKGEISKLLKSPDIGFLEILDEYYEEKEGLEMGDTYVWVESEAQLLELVEVLSKESVFAVDTEQHSLRSFLGFTALIQISTAQEDYLLDTIKLHDMMGLLSPVFANPRIYKVLHGADNDVLWLQRDFHIYVVNLFDTAKACDVLAKPQRSLAFLLEVYCGVATNKLFQREDWRQRPLSDEMIQYARTDAHYLLYIAHCLCTELKLQKKEISTPPGDKLHFLLETSRRSNATCLQLFSKDIEGCPGEVSASSIISRCLNDQGNISSSQFNSKFQELVRRLCLWRDILARVHDESLRFVLSENAIIALASKIPITEKDVISFVSDADVAVESPSSVVSSHLEVLMHLFHENITNLDDMFELFIKRNLGVANSCPLSVYNYGFLSKTSLGLTNGSIPNRNGFRASRQIAKRTSRQQFVKKFSCKSPVYHNCKIYANDGRLLCYCDRRKLEWYLNKDLAKLVEEDPPSIMLLFEPKGRPEDEDNDFYIQSKKNICVGCGEGNHYLRYRIIPSCYRIHFPEHLKSHRSHDIVLLCVDCHEVAHAAAEKYKRQVAGEFGIPLFIRKVVDFDNSQNGTVLFPIEESGEMGVSPLHLRTAAMALLRHGSQMPAQRRKELMQIVMKYYGGREISEKDLENALLVGMSPFERKRFEKRGYAFKHCTGSLNVNEENVNNTCGNATVSNTSEIDQEHDYADFLTKEDAETSTQSSCSNVEGDSDALDADWKDLADINIAPNLARETSVTNPPKDMATKHDSKMSLLGHGPHGKQVVEFLLKEYGEDGVSEFCQKWRQVFVDALHPRFLPAGWDVMHSGRRFRRFQCVQTNQETFQYYC